MTTREERIIEILTTHDHDHGTADSLLKEHPGMDPDKLEVLLDLDKDVKSAFKNRVGNKNWWEDNFDYENASGSVSARFKKNLIARVKIEVEKDDGEQSA